MVYESFIRPLLFLCDPESIHHTTLSVARITGNDPTLRAILRRLYVIEDDRLRTNIGGVDFSNPVGLAGGFDKNGVAVQGMASVGFGSVEVGSVSAYPSKGNPVRPRLFRAPDDEAIVVYYGVPNDGSRAVADRLAPFRLSVPLGINLVETNTGRPADHEQVIEELVLAAKPFLKFADYFTLNLNCPNTTAGKSPFDNPENLGSLLAGYAAYEAMPPTFVKVVPTTKPETVDRTLEAIDPFPFVKGIAFGLPTGKPYTGLKTPVAQLDRMPGTLCGRPVRALVDNSIRTWYPRMDTGRHVLIGAGGIFNAEDAYKKIRLGASLVQLYTALIYRGPSLVKQINQGLCRLMERDGLTQISEAVGLDACST